jgi:hypothetical protein
MLEPIVDGNIGFEAEVLSRVRHVEAMTENPCPQLVQIAYSHEVYVLDLEKMKGEERGCVMF